MRPSFLNAKEARSYFWVVLFVREVLIAPLLCYLLYNFWKYRRLEFIYRRRPLLTMVLAVCTILEIMAIPICRYQIMFDKDARMRTIATWLTLLILVHETLLIPRFWFLYFDWQLGKDLTKVEWKQQLYLSRLQVVESDESQNPSAPSVKIDIANDVLETAMTMSIAESKSETTNTNTNANTNTSANANVGKVLTIIRTDRQQRRKVPWTLRYREYLGNTHFMLALFVMYFIGFFGIGAMIRFVSKYNDATVFAVAYTACADIVLFFCAYKIRSCHDLFEIQKELKAILYNVLFWAIPLVVTLSMFGEATYERQLSLMTFAALLHATDALIMLRPKDLYYSLEESTCCKWNCLRVRGNYQAEHESMEICQNNEKSDPRTMRMTVANRSSKLREHSSSRRATELSCQITLENVLSEKDGFELFASHLVKELSLENVLFLVEYMQLKHFLSVHQLNLRIQDLGYQIPIYHSLIQKAYHPQLLRADMSADMAWSICLDMFEYLSTHYVLPNAVALLNLSHESSSIITVQIHQITANRAHVNVENTLPALLSVFDSAAMDIVRLLRGDSFYRFQLSGECIRYCEDLV
ncbi:hypothetical protein RFI_08858 [Reticulomyxa filosa]|uniref:RGS domain-containing protein n=1 Tax=Reticulomyxa filosa TaxID=46433 RepID=X6NQI2_RETFI|nr:hypothetical protein RFI_08858 [Reticulomyxa filosa]|eukprot:ETO28276.1 hypothetical protein RFI_08858 [Reticulomyxa filosa]